MTIEYLFMDTELSPLGKRIKSRLKELGLKQNWLADQVGLSPSQITQLMKGGRGTTIDNLFEIGAILGIEDDELVKLYRHQKVSNKTTVRKTIETGLNSIERLDESRLQQVAEYVQLIANSARGKPNASPRQKENKA